MRNLLLASALLLFSAPAYADVILDTHLSGTGDNVIFNSLIGSLALGSFNGQHTGVVDFTDLSGNPLFTAAANGNDIKITGTNNLQIQVFSLAGVVIPTLTDVFSLKGTGDVTAFVTANEPNGTTKLFTFDLGLLDPNAQSGFTLSAINGETINKFALVDVGGSIVDFEHYRIDVAPAAVPAPALGAGLPGILSACIGVWALQRRRRSRV
jgi:hypothetical protein